jgi:predicted HTH domain antitoxin
MDLVISEDTLRAARTTAGELKQEIAVLLYRQDRLTLVQASEMAEMSPFAFQHLLASREIGPHYDVEDFEEDLETLRNRSQV